MRQLGACGLAVTLVVGLGTAVAWAEDGETDNGDAKAAASASSSRGGLFSRWFGSKENKAEDKKSFSQPDNHLGKKPIASRKTVNQVDEAAAEQARQQAVLFRRLAVCNKLMEIAVQNNDNNLLRRAEELDERVWTAYEQRTAFRRARASDSEAVERMLDQQPNSAKALETPAYTVAGGNRGGHTSVQEVNP